MGLRYPPFWSYSICLSQREKIGREQSVSVSVGIGGLDREGSTTRASAVLPSTGGHIHVLDLVAFSSCYSPPHVTYPLAWTIAPPFSAGLASSRPPPSQRRISPTLIEGGMESPLQLLFPGLRSIWRSFLHACPCSLLVPSLARSCFSFPGQCKYGSWDGVSSLHLRVNGKSSSTLP